MKNAQMDESENIIHMTFNGNNNINIPTRTYENYDDPLEDLLNEFRDEINEEDQNKTSVSVLKRSAPLVASQSQSCLEMTDLILNQTNQIKDDIKRLKYFLGELYID